VTNRIESQAHGFKATLLHVQKSEIDRQIVFVPPLHEQQRIGKTLGVWDSAIATTERLLTNSRQQLDALSDMLLTGKKKLRGELQWSTKRLSDLIAESRVVGSTGNSARKLTVKLYGRGVVGKNDKRAGSASTQYFRRSAGQFIYSKLDFLNGAFGLIPAQLDGFESTIDLPTFDFIEPVNPTWFLYYVSRPTFYLNHLRLANGGRKARRVNPLDFLRVVIRVPPLEEQNAIAEVIEVARKALALLEHQSSLLKQQKLALIRQLLSGTRRFCDVPTEPEVAA
jgi:type I restriction enzyme S subunit